MSNFIIKVAGEGEHKYAEEICHEYAESAKARGTGIAKRSPEYVKKQMSDGKGVIAIEKSTKKVAGFCYIESFSGKKYVANSGLIVFPEFRKHGLATEIKNKAFELSRKRHPESKLFGLTTSLAIMKINSDLGYRPVTFNELTDDEEFWKGCQSCVNYQILMSKDKKNCLCTGMLYDPAEKERKKKWKFNEKESFYRRLKRLKFFSMKKETLKSFFGIV